jgi:hypothetical protein
MKPVSLYILLAFLLVTCDKNGVELIEDDLLIDGYYGGSFAYDGLDYWYLLEINHNNYEEWPSGGAIYQKSMGCLTTGTYSINDSIITFISDSIKFEDYPFPCATGMSLPGEYQINCRDDNDSIVFEKETENSTIVYYLKRANSEN